MALTSLNKQFIHAIMLLVAGACLYGYCAMSFASTIPRADIWTPNGAVYATLVDDSTLYMGGDFTYVGPSTGSGIAMDAVSAQIEDAMPKVNGPIYAVVSDGANGWYIGGAFTNVGGVTRNNIAHIEKVGLSYGVDSGWNPNASNGAVRAMALSGATLYVGGDFTDVGTIGGAARNRLAAIQTSDGTATAWNPNADNVVRALALSGTTTLYVGGDFANVGGAARNHLAAIQTSNGAATAWNPNADDVVRTLVLSGTTTLYVGGDFDNVGGALRNRLAAIQASDGTATAWNPGGAGITAINTLILSGGGTLYVGGDFDDVGGVTRNNIAELSEGSGFATNWNPNADDVVLSMTLSGKAANSLFVGGDFMTINGKPRTRLAEINLLTANAETWAISVEDKVYALAMSNDRAVLFAGGDFTSAGGQERNHLAALNISKVVDVLATVNGTVYTVIADGASGGWYIGGSFTSVGGVARNNIARIGSDSVLDETWDPNANGAIRAMALSPGGTVLYVGGDFTNINGKARNRLAALDTKVTTNIDRGWNPDANDSVRAMDLSSDGLTLYVGGDFTNLGPSTGGGIAIDVTSTELENSLPRVNGPVFATVSDGANGWYIGGAFDDVGGVKRNNIAHIEKIGTSYSVDSGWNPDADGAVRALALSGTTTLYLGGEFTTVGGIGRNRLAAVQISNGTATTWNPGGAGISSINALVLSGNSTLYVGGNFNNTTTIGGQHRDYLAELNESDGSGTNWNPDADGVVRTMALSGASTLYVGGDFSNVGGSARNKIAALQTSDGTATGWNPGGAGITSINTLTLSGGGTLYVGGDFTTATTIGGANRNYIAELSEISGLATTWNPRADGVVLAIILTGKSPNSLFVGGDFSVIGGKSRPRLAELNLITGISETWTISMEDQVNAIAMSDDNSVVYVGSDFTKIAGSLTRNHIAALKTTVNEAITDDWNPNVGGGSVHSMVLSGNDAALYVGGDFTTIAGAARNRIAALNTTGTTNIDKGWNPNVGNGTVYTLALAANDTDLYAGGDFTLVEGATRNRLAKLDTTATTNIDSGWDPDPDNVVRTMALSADATLLYAGGDFTAIGADNRNHFAAIDTTTGNATSLIIPVNNPINALAVSDADIFIYLGGNTVSVVGGLYNNGELLGVQAGALSAFESDVNGIVRTMAINGPGTILYIGGDFTSVKSQPQNRIAALNTTSGNALSWDPDPDGAVSDIELSNDESTLYVAGDFTTFNGGANSRRYIAAISAESGALTPWIPDADAPVLSLSLSSDSSVLYVGGDFSVIGQQARTRLAALSTSTGGALPAWAPVFAGKVYATHLSTDEDIIYVGGENELKAFKVSDGTAAPAFTPGAIVGTIETLEISSDDQMLYAGGDFTSFYGQGRNRIARYNLATNTITAWNPGADLPVHHLVLTNNNNNLFVAGSFTGIGTDPARTGLAALPMTPPDTSVSPAASSYTTSQNVTLTCTDNTGLGLGCLATYYTMDDTTPTTASTLYTTPIVIPGDSTVTIKYFSVDNEGTREPVKTAVYVVDTSAPTTTASPGAGTYNLLDGPISLICRDVGGSGCGATYYTTDDKPPTVDSTRYTGPIALAALDGVHFLRFFSIDGAGNVETIANRVDYVIDVTPPVTTLSHSNGTYSPPQTITLTCKDVVSKDNPGSGCANTYYTTDLSVPTETSTRYTGPITISAGTVVRAMSVDVVGNPGAMVEGIYAFTIGVGESRSGMGSVGVPLLLIILAGVALRYRRRLMLLRL